MATLVGSVLTASGDAGSTSIASPTKTTTSGNFLAATVKWEGAAGSTLTGATDTAGNSYTIAGQLEHSGGGGGPQGAIVYAPNITANAANVITLTFSASVSFRRAFFYEFSGIAPSSPADGAAVSASGNSASYSTANIVTTTSGMVLAVVAGFNSITFSAAGTPTFTGQQIATPDDSAFGMYLLSNAARTVSPAATGDFSDLWVMVAAAFKDAVTVPTYNVDRGGLEDILREGILSNSELRSAAAWF